MVISNISNRFLDDRPTSKNRFLTHPQEPRVSQPFCPIHLRRALSRWENEGGALQPNQILFSNSTSPAIAP